MTRSRMLATGVATTLLLTAFGPAGTTAEGLGTATTTSVPLHVTAAGTAVNLGTTELTATNDGDENASAPWSTVALTLAEVAGTEFGRVVVASDGETNSDGATVDENTAAGAVAATVGDVLAVADDVADSATAALTTLDTEATVLEGLVVSTTISDAIAAVDVTGASARHALAVAGVDLDLAHVLGSVLAELPLADLVTIADALGVTVPVDIGAASDVAAATEALLVAVADAVAASELVQPAANALVAADAGLLAELQTLLTTAQSLDPVGDPAGALVGLEALLGGTMPTNCSAAVLGLTLDVINIEDELAAVVVCLTDLVDAHASSLTDELDALQTAVDDYVDAVGAVLLVADALQGEGTSLGGLMGDVATLLGNLLEADLVAVGPIAVTQQVRAVGGDLAGSTATHTCDVTTLTVVGVAPVDLADCDGTGSTVSTALDALNATLGAVLDAVGGVDAGDGVALELFGTGEDAVVEEEAGVVRATSVLEVLSLTIPDVTVTPCDVEVVGQVGCALGLDLDDLLGDALTTVDDLLTDAHTEVTTAVAAVTPLVTEVEAVLGDLVGLDLGAAAGAQAVVDAAIGAVQAVLDGLDLGELGTGGGATVAGVRIVIDPELVAEHAVVAAAGPPAPAPDSPTDPAPAPGGGGPLPNTGGGAGLAAVLALGAGAWLWRRREDG